MPCQHSSSCLCCETPDQNNAGRRISAPRSFFRFVTQLLQAASDMHGRFFPQSAGALQSAWPRSTSHSQQTFCLQHVQRNCLTRNARSSSALKLQRHAGDPCRWHGSPMMGAVPVQTCMPAMLLAHSILGNSEAPPPLALQSNLQHGIDTA